MSKYISPTRLEEITADIKKYIDAKFQALETKLAALPQITEAMKKDNIIYALKNGQYEAATPAGINLVYDDVTAAATLDLNPDTAPRIDIPGLSLPSPSNPSES